MTYPGDVPHIALIGRAGSGKSTVAQLLCDRFDLGYQRLSFAAPLKVMCDTDIDRELLQRVGTGVRALYPDAWVNLFLYEKARLEFDRGDAVRFVVDDVRFSNEIRTLTGEGFITIRVTAPEATRIARLTANGKLSDPEQLNHVSERALDAYKAQHTIQNYDGGIDEVVDQLESILNKVRR